MWFNFHTHSTYCDGKSEIAACIDSAQKKSLIALGFSSHAPLPFSAAWCMKPGQLDQYIHDIHKATMEATNLEVYTGLEVDYIPALTSIHDFNETLDYTIGSIHFVEQFRDGRRWEIDASHALFNEGLQAIFHGDIREAIHRYYELTREMIVKACPTVIGHLDKIKIQNSANSLFDERDAWYQQEVKKTVDAIAKTDAIIEVNTRGIYHRKSTTTYPSPWVLEYVLQKNIPITISSDAHHADDLVNQFEETAKMLDSIGFKQLSVLQSGSWQQKTFDSNGIKN